MHMVLMQTAVPYCGLRNNQSCTQHNHLRRRRLFTAAAIIIVEAAATTASLASAILSQDCDDVKRYRSSSSRDSLIFISLSSRSTRATFCHQKVERTYNFCRRCRIRLCRQCRSFYWSKVPWTLSTVKKSNSTLSPMYTGQYNPGIRTGLAVETLF